MKKKTSVIAASVASIVMCSSVIAGSTFALFTSDSSTNIVVKSAKLKVDAKIKSAVTYESEIDQGTLAVTYGEAKAIEASGNTLTLENVKPGDKYGVQLEISADASIDYQYRVSLAHSGDGELYKNLLVGVDGVYYSDYVSSWENGANIGDGVVNVEIIVPAYLTNEYMEKECNLEFKVEAVQGNATVSDADSHVTHLVESAEKLVELFNGNKVAEGDTIALMTKIDEAEVTTSVKDFEIKGCDVGKITFNAPESTIDYLVNKTGTVVAEAVANESLHIYGAVTNALTVNSGRVVLMDGASVASVTMAPEADNTAKFVVANKDKVTVEEVTIVGEGVSILENVELNNVEVADNSNFFAEDIESDTVTVYNAKSFYAALENEKYSTIILGNDIECPECILVERSVTIDGNGHTILSAASRILRVNTNDVEVNLLNAKLLHTGKAERAIQVDIGITGVKLNIDNCTAEATYYTINICNDAGVDLTINNSELTGWGVINAWSAGYKIHVTNSVLKGINDKSYSAEGWNGFGTVVVEGDTTHQTEMGAESLELIFENCTIIAESLNGNIQKCILFNSYSNGNNVSFVDCTFEYGKDCLLLADNGTNNNLSITGEKSNVVTVTDGAELVAALESTKRTDIILAQDITVTEVKNIVIDKSVTLDLNGNKLTIPGKSTITVKDGGELLLKDGDLDMTGSAVNLAVILVEKDSTLSMDGVTLNTYGYGVFPYGNAAAVNIKNSKLYSAESIPVGTNANTVDNYNVVINIENSELAGGSGMLVNVPCTVNIKDSVLSGSMHGLIARGGNITVKNSTISNTAEDGDFANYFDNKNWADGNTVNLAGLTIGNKGSGYQYPTNVTLIDTEVTSTGYYPTVYMYGNAAKENGATLTYDAKSNVGEVVKGGGIVNVNNDTVTVVIYNVNDLIAFAQDVNRGNNYAGKTVVLANDIDLGNKEWTPIGTKATPFSGTFDGLGHTVSNLNVNIEGSFAGLFGFTKTENTTCVIKNVTVHNAKVSGVSQVGVIVGDGYTGRIENCHVTGLINVTGNYHVGGLMGYGYASFNNCSVIGEEGSTITGIYKESDLEGDAIGGLVGYAPEVSGEYTNLTVKGVSVAGTRKVGGLIGQVGTYTRTFREVVVENVTVSINATQEYIDDNAGKIFVGGVVGEITSGTIVTFEGKASNIVVNGAAETTTGAIAGGSRSSNTTIDTIGVETKDITVNVG